MSTRTTKRQSEWGKKYQINFFPDFFSIFFMPCLCFCFIQPMLLFRMISRKKSVHFFVAVTMTNHQLENQRNKKAEANEERDFKGNTFSIVFFPQIFKPQKKKITRPFGLNDGEKNWMSWVITNWVPDCCCGLKFVAMRII